MKDGIASMETMQSEPAGSTSRRRFWDALDERLGLKGLQYPIPEHANKLAYSLGGGLIIYAALQPVASHIGMG
jgi:hypothetical protein